MVNEAKKKIIKDTVRDSITSELSEKFQNRVSDKAKAEEMLMLTKSKIVSIINSMTDGEILPENDLDSQAEFEEHVLCVVAKVKQRLLIELEQENG